MRTVESQYQWVPGPGNAEDVIYVINENRESLFLHTIGEKMRCRFCSKSVTKKTLSKYRGDPTLCRWCEVLADLQPLYLIPSTERRSRKRKK